MTLTIITRSVAKQLSADVDLGKKISTDFMQKSWKSVGKRPSKKFVSDVLN